MALLTSAYPNFEPRPETVEVYVQMLQDLPANVLFAAVHQCIAECRFFPTVAEIRERARAIQPAAQIPSAAEAWEEVMREVRRVGYYGVPAFENPITARVVKALGWREICMSENVVADRAHFMRMYEQVAQRVEQYVSLLPPARALLDFGANGAGTHQLVRSLARALAPDRMLTDGRNGS